MTTIYERDAELLADEDWEVGAYWSRPGLSGHYYRHPEHHPDWAELRETPCSEDSLRDDEGFVGPSGAHESATDALLDRMSE